MSSKKVAAAPKNTDTKKAAAATQALPVGAEPAKAPKAKKVVEKKAAPKAAPAAAAAAAKAVAPAAPKNTSFLKAGKVVILLNGRYAGHKAVIVKSMHADKKHHFPSILVAGIERYPLKVTRAMGQKKVNSRSKVKPFLKLVNVAHVMPTRYGLDVDLKNIVDYSKIYGEKSQRSKVRSSVRKVFEERYKAGKNRWFFTKLRF